MAFEDFERRRKLTWLMPTFAVKSSAESSHWLTGPG